MPQRLTWTDAADDTIRTMRAGGATWSMISGALGVSRNTIIERGRRIKASGGPQPALATARPPEEDRNRPPLPAGHPVSWALLTAGTVLEGTPYVPLRDWKTPGAAEAGIQPAAGAGDAA